MLGRYELLGELARGGMGAIYLARAARVGGFERLVAIKLLHQHLAEEEGFVAMLLDEARTAAHVEHPNAVGILDVCESAVGPYLVMSYVDGFPLGHVLHRARHDDTLRVRLAMRLVVDAAHGLHAAHTARSPRGEKLGIVHRDVSPSNVLVGTDGLGRIIDFGIALAASRITSSRPGVLKGKPSYMAPEQARGAACDARSDVFSLAIVAWESLVHQRLFRGDSDVVTLMRVAECRIDSPSTIRPELPSALSDVVMRALAADPADRYASARDFAIALERAAGAAQLLASTSEVEEAVRLLFEREIEQREAAVRRLLQESWGPTEPLASGELALVPKLLDPPRAAAPASTAEPVVEVSGVVAERSRAVDVPRDDAPVDAMVDVMVDEVPVEVVPTVHRRAPRRAVMLIALALAGVLGGALAALHERSNRIEAVPLAETDAPAATRTSVGSPAIAPSSATSLSASALTTTAASPPDAGPAHVVAPVAPRASLAPAAPSRVAPAPAARPRSTVDAPAPEPRATTRPAPVLEANPYLH